MIQKIDTSVTAACSGVAMLVLGGYLAFVAQTEEAWETMSWHAGVALFAALVALVGFIVGHYWFYRSVIQYIISVLSGGISGTIGVCNAFFWRQLCDENASLMLFLFYASCLGLVFSWAIYLEAKAEAEAKIDRLDGIEF